LIATHAFESLGDTRALEEVLAFTGTQVNYYFVCKRTLWLFSHGLDMEETSDLVLLGRFLHERGYAAKDG